MILTQLGLLPIRVVTRITNPEKFLRNYKAVATAGYFMTKGVSDERLEQNEQEHFLSIADHDFPARLRSSRVRCSEHSRLRNLQRRQHLEHPHRQLAG
jgi:hypothetical protein